MGIPGEMKAADRTERRGGVGWVFQVKLRQLIELREGVGWGGYSR